MKILISQFESIKPNDKTFNKYLSNFCKKKDIDLIVLGEYVLNPFFKTIKKDYKKINKDFLALNAYLNNIATKYKTTIIAPIYECKNNKIFKSIAIIDEKKTNFYQSQRLMQMEHWNERDFFNNDLRAKEPFVFKVNGFNISVLFGFEMHFDELWIKLKKKNVDMVIVPTASTFNSNDRWIRLFQTRSFLNNCFVVRVNRVGDYVEDNIIWRFYGDSFITLPDGNLGDMLDDKEGVMLSEIKKIMIDEARQNWGFR